MPSGGLCGLLLDRAHPPLPIRYPNALELCLRNFRTDPARFYGPAAGLPLGAGLLISDCVLALPHPTEVQFETGLGLAIVLIHECDIDQNNERFFNDKLLACPIIRLDEFCAECEDESGPGSWSGILQAIARDTVYRAMYIPPLPRSIPCPEMDAGGIIYLNHMSPCRVEWISVPSVQAICSLSALGLRALDIKLTNHLLREKAASLWFSR